MDETLKFSQNRISEAGYCCTVRLGCRGCYPVATIVVNCAVQLCNVHAAWLSRRRSDNGRGPGVGNCCACGALDRKDGRLLRDRSSAKSFATPAICAKDSVKPKYASKKKRQRSRCMSCGCLLERLATMQTTAWLSQWPLTSLPRQPRPHTATATSTANISLKAMPCSWPTGYWNCHHWDWDPAPQPQAPEASDANSTSWDSSGGKYATPFQLAAKDFHQQRSTLNC